MEKEQSVAGTFSRRQLLVGGLVAGTTVLALSNQPTSAATNGIRPLGTPAGRNARITGSKKLNWGLSSYPTSFNPFANVGIAAGTITTATQRGLLQYDQHGNIVSALATAVKPLGENRYLIDLRSGVRFQNGAKLTSRDVAFTLDTMKEPSLGASLIAQAQEVKSIKLEGDDRLVLVLEAPDASLPAYLATPYMPIISRTSNVASGEFIGCGPFRITEKSSSAITCTKFDSFFRHGFPLLSGINFQTLANGASAVEALAAGEVDIVDSLAWADFSSVRSNSNLKLLAVGGPFMYLAFNVTSGPLADPKVRQAIGYSVDRAAVVTDAFYGGGTPLYGPPMPRNSQYFDPQLSNSWGLDPGKTQSMLKAAGYGSGLSLKLLANSQYSFYQNAAQVLQSSLAQGGVNVSLVLPDWSTQEQDGIQGNYDMAIMGSAGEVNDPSFLSLFLQGPPAFQRSFGYDSSTINNLLAEGLRKTTFAQRKPIYDQIQKLMVEQAPIVPLNWRDQAFGTREAVKGFVNIPGFLTFYSGYTLEQTTVA